MLVSPAPEAVRAELVGHARAAAEELAALRGWLSEVYGPAAADTPDAVGRERYGRWVRYWTGADLDLDEAYRWAWTEFHDLDRQMRVEAEKVRPGSTPMQAMHWLETDGEAIEGAETAREYLQGLMDQAINDLQGVHFDLAEPVTRVESRIAPAGSAAAPYYTAPRWTSPVPAAPGCRCSAASGSRSGTWSAPGTTRASPATTCSWRSGTTWPAACPPTRSAWAASAPTWRAGRSTPSA